MVEDQLNLITLANANVTKLTQNAGDIGVLVLIDEFGSRMGRFLDLEKSSFRMTRDTNFMTVVNRMQGFANQPVNQARIDELVVKDSLTVVERNDLAISLGFQNTQAMDDFKCGMQQDMDTLKNTYIDPISNSNDDTLLMIKSLDRYSPTQIVGWTGTQAGNYGVAMGAGSCGNDIDESTFRLNTVCANGVSNSTIQYCEGYYRIRNLECDFHRAEDVSGLLYGASLHGKIMPLFTIVTVVNIISDHSDCIDDSRLKLCQCLKNGY